MWVEVTERQICTHSKRTYFLTELWGWSGQSQKTAASPDTGSVEQRLEGVSLELLQMEPKHWLDVDQLWTLASAAVE